MSGYFFWIFLLLILYAYFGYPLALALLARFRPAPNAFPPSRRRVTLLIAALNEQAVIRKKLENSLALKIDGEPLQILVAADGSTDATAEIVKSFAGRGIDLSYTPERKGKLAAISTAIPRCAGEIIVFSDANNLYDPDTLQKLLLPFADPTVGATTGAKVIRKGDGDLSEMEGFYWKYESFIKMQETRLGCTTGVVGEILAIRRDLFEVPPPNIITDDFYIAISIIRRGYRVIYVPEARSIERVSLNEQDEIVRRARIVAGRYQFMVMPGKFLPFRRPLVVWQILSHKFLRPLVPFFMLGALIANIAGCIFPIRVTGLSVLQLASPYGAIFLALQACFYLLAALYKPEKKKTWMGKFLYLPAFLVNSNLAALIGLYRFITRKQSPAWKRVARRDEVS